MLALLQQVGSQVPGWLQIMVAALAALQSVAIVGGIMAAYYRFIEEKPHTSRVRPAVSGAVEVQNDTIYLRAKVSVQNNGQVKVDFDLEFTALEIFPGRLETAVGSIGVSKVFSSITNGCDLAKR